MIVMAPRTAAVMSHGRGARSSSSKNGLNRLAIARGPPSKAGKHTRSPRSRAKSASESPSL
jgi:hypothetical protein